MANVKSGTKTWSEGLYGCFSDVKLCWVTLFCPCLVFGYSGEKVNLNKFKTCFGYFIPILNVYLLHYFRREVKKNKGIEEGFCRSLMYTLFCSFCSLNQIARLILDIFSRSVIMSGGWNSDLCGCFSDCKLCILTWCCPCFILGNTAEKIGDNKWQACIGSLIPLLNLYCMYDVRQKIKEQKGIDEGAFKGLAMILCCGFCALNQMARESGVEGLSMARE